MWGHLTVSISRSNGGRGSEIGTGFAKCPNPYDPNAVAIWLDAHTLPDESLEELRHTLPGMGSDIDDLMSQRHWHIGYIPKTDAIHLQPRIDAAIEAHNIETDASGEGFVRLGHPANLSFDGTGKPLVTFTI